MFLKPQERRDNQPGPLHKKKPPALPNGLSLDSCKNNYHHHQSSDQENNPHLAHAQGKKNKKKHLNKKHSVLKPGQKNCKASDSESVSGESKPSVRNSSRDRLTDVSTPTP
ncbi:autism susceptibility gene 2 protein-like [Nematolebias whitei]|uniref:autism susceptibility gene 2 protein-like n=1 Tax=Nematolebias whitei TaxID=451745 RepID=UPI0018985054|nr:autism susceptibility gene 2 protein-like [Nematolebias whitei]